MKKFILIVIVFIILIVIVTFPLVFNITTAIPGFFSTDESYSQLWDSWRIHYSYQNNLLLESTDLIAYPFRINLYISGYVSSAWLIVLYFLSILTTPAVTYNIQVLLSFFLTGIFTYLLVSYISRNRLSAFLSGIIFSFCPYQFVRIWQHLTLAYSQWIVLCLFAAILLKERESRKQMLLFLLSIMLLFAFDYSNMYLGIISLVFFLIYIFLYRWKIKLFRNRLLLFEDFNFLKKIIILVIIAFTLLLPQFLPIVQKSFKQSKVTPASTFNPYRRPFEDLFEQSAKPLSYFLPATAHPIFGKFTEQFIGTHLYGISFTEHTLYLGWISLILSFIALRGWRRKRKLGVKSYELEVTDKDDFYIGFFIFLAIVAWFFSQPPWWKMGLIKIYMPSFFMYKILPMFRAYCRFGIVVMLAVAVLAGFGLKFILERFKTQKSKIAITTLFCSLVLFEFWNWPPYKVIDVSKVPAVYYWLKAQPQDFVIAEYPLDANSPNEMYKFYQTKHEKKIINGTIPWTYANKVAQTITKLSDPDTPSILKWMGVKYVLVHKEDYLKTDLVEEIEELNKIPRNPGLKLIKSFPVQDCPQKNIICVQQTGPIDVYEVNSLPKEPKI